MTRNVEQWVVRKHAVESERGVVAARNWMAAQPSTEAAAEAPFELDAAGDGLAPVRA